MCAQLHFNMMQGNKGKNAQRTTVRKCTKISRNKS
jgi:hypothetical protein